MLQTDRIEEFFALARERYSIMLRRQAGESRPWTDWEMLDKYHVCNVFRDDDAVSRCVMKELLPRFTGQEYPLVTLARLVNSESSLRVLLDGCSLLPSAGTVREQLEGVSINTSAYKINTPKGLNSREGIALLYSRALAKNWPPTESLRSTFRHLTSLGLTEFIAYQATQDLKGSALPLHPGDEMSWTYFGIGAIRGCLRLEGHDLGQWARSKSLARPKDGMRAESLAGGGAVKKAVSELAKRSVERLTSEVSQQMLILSQSAGHWPTDWPPFALGDIEHMLCEYDKISRWREIGPGAGARRFKGAH